MRLHEDKIYIFGQIVFFLCCYRGIVCESENNTPANEDTSNDNTDIDASVANFPETEKVLTEAENVIDVTEPVITKDVTEPVIDKEVIEHVSSTTALVTEKIERLKTSTHSPPSNFINGPTKEAAPENTFAVWNSEGKICLLAKFDAVFTISYPTSVKEQTIEVVLPPDVNVKGRCESATKSPLLRLSWGRPSFEFNVTFSKVSDEGQESWIASSIGLKYDTSGQVFDDATNVGTKMATSKAIRVFETPLGRSYVCPAKEVVFLYIAGKQVATVKLEDIHLQPFDVKDAKLSPGYRCSQVVIEGPEEEPFVQDETIPLAVGCTLGLLTLVILVAFSVHRAYTAAKVDYNTME